ncbi:MAG: nucleotidyltransferase domain-containing protein [Gammaproteobacteria bacterium]|jgi:predicted nucleotidyltransferase|nr:nucleotidyltransferase domain-containing protein [Gammaproteobacteria bacterium]
MTSGESNDIDFPFRFEGGKARWAAGVSPARWALGEARRLVRATLTGTGIDAWLFGSRATGHARTWSDIDIALDGHGTVVPPEVFSSVAENLEESLVPFKADLVDLATTDAEFRDAVRAAGVKWTL